MEIYWDGGRGKTTTASYYFFSWSDERDDGEEGSVVYCRQSAEIFTRDEESSSKTRKECRIRRWNIKANGERFKGSPGYYYDIKIFAFSHNCIDDGEVVQCQAERREQQSFRDKRRREKNESEEKRSAQNKKELESEDDVKTFLWC